MIHQPVWLEHRLTQLRVSTGFAPISTDELVIQILARIKTSANKKAAPPVHGSHGIYINNFR